MSCIFAKRSEGEYPMSKDNQVSYVWIVALKDILEVGEFEGCVDIERNQPEIFHHKT